MKNQDTLQPYECGLPSYTNRISFQYISLHALIGVLYVLFDLEILFLYPLGSSLAFLQSHDALTFLNIWSFFAILSLSFIYEWYQGALDIL